MALLSDRALKELIKDGLLRISPFEEAAISSTSIDLRLGPKLVRYPPQTIQLGKIPEGKEIDLSSSGYTLAPGEFILGMTKERVGIPNGYQGFIETKGNIARAGISAHNADGHIDPGFDGHITLEIKNMHKNVSILLLPDVHICQLFIHELSSPSDIPYKGKYSGQTMPTIYLPDKYSSGIEDKVS
jgi:dCTP deaminase